MKLSERVIPDHVPQHLVEEFDLILGKYTADNPFDSLVPKACEGPDVTYAVNVFPGEEGGGPAWVPRRMKDFLDVYNDAEHFTNRGFVSIAKLINEKWELVPAEQEDTLHTQFRQLLNPIFGPGPMSRMEQQVKDSADLYLANLSAKGECEFMYDYAFPFPVRVTLDLLGLPQDRMREFLEWQDKMAHSGELSVFTEGVQQVSDYLKEVIAERRVEPKQDLISRMIQSKVGGRELSQDELLGFAFNLYIGGLDTVSANIGNMMRYLAENLEQQNFLRNNPDRIGDAIEEMLRAFAAVTTFKVCRKERTLGGVTIKPGDKVALCTTLAGRDKDYYANPHEVDFNRKAQHVSFAIGPHTCLGVHLARREMRIGIETFLKNIPEFRLKPGAVIMTQTGSIAQPSTLPLVWN